MNGTDNKLVEIISYEFPLFTESQRGERLLPVITDYFKSLLMLNP